MTRDEQEMALWRRVFDRWYSREDYESDTCGNIADAAVAEFRKRYPVESAAPDAVWYDEPPFTKDGTMSPVWLSDYPFPILVAYFGDGWAYEVPGRSNRWHPLAGRRVCPITRPPEPNK